MALPGSTTIACPLGGADETPLLQHHLEGHQIEKSSNPCEFPPSPVRVSYTDLPNPDLRYSKVRHCLLSETTRDLTPSNPATGTRVYDITFLC
jgi:hypothetical protein